MWHNILRMSTKETYPVGWINLRCKVDRKLYKGIRLVSAQKAFLCNENLRSRFEIVENAWWYNYWKFGQKPYWQIHNPSVKNIPVVFLAHWSQTNFLSWITFRFSCPQYCRRSWISYVMKMWWFTMCMTPWLDLFVLHYNTWQLISLLVCLFIWLVFFSFFFFVVVG